MKHLKEALFGAYKECTADERDGVFYTNDEADDQALQSVAKDMYIERLEKEKKALSAENAHLTGQLAEARAKIAAAESSDQAAELADLRDYVQRLKIANAELKNKAKGLPKNHSGYEVTVFNNKIKVPYEDTFTITDEKTKKSKKITKIKYATVYETVLAAQKAGIAAARAGVSGAEVDKAARDIIESAGELQRRATLSELVDNSFVNRAYQEIYK